MLLSDCGELKRTRVYIVIAPYVTNHMWLSQKFFLRDAKCNKLFKFWKGQHHKHYELHNQLEFSVYLKEKIHTSQQRVFIRADDKQCGVKYNFHSLS